VGVSWYQIVPMWC